MNRKLSAPKYDEFIAKAVYYQEYMASQFWSPFSMTRQYHLPEVREQPWWLEDEREKFVLPNIDQLDFKQKDVPIIEG